MEKTIIAFLLLMCPLLVEASPNIIFILVDDMEVEMLEKIPALKDFKEDSLFFDNFFVTDPVCCPSRSTFLRGQYPHNHRVLEVTNAPEGGWQSFRDRGHESNTVATILQSAGYTTALHGKYLNGYGLPWNPYSTWVAPGWADWFVAIGNLYSNFNVSYNQNGAIFFSGSGDYMTDQLSDRAVTFIESAEEPFFLFINPTSPHAPANPAPRHDGAFATTSLPLPPSFNEADMSDKPTWMQSLPLLGAGMIQSEQELYRNGLESMLAVGELLDAVIVSLENEGILDETYIFFTSDNGFHRGQHRLRQGKRSFYEEDIRVPLIVKTPNNLVGTRSQMVTNNDFLETFADIAGTTTPEFNDGTSFYPLFSSDPEEWRVRTLIERWQSGTLFPEGNAVRTDSLKLCSYVGGQEEFYDLANDPYEMESIATSSSMRDQLDFERSILSTCAGDVCHDAEFKEIGVGFISATPNPCTIESGQTGCATTIVWDTHNISEAWVQIRLQNGTLFHCAQSNTPGSKITGSWIKGHPREFLLYSANDCTTPQTLLDAVSVSSQ